MRPPTKPYFRVPPGVTVHFYVHRHAFLMAGEKSRTFGGDTQVSYVDAVNQIVEGMAKPTEAFGPGQQCPDYLLSKQLKSAAGTKSHRYDTIGYHEVSDYVTRRVPGEWAVVSVRNREGRLAYLSTAADLLAKDGFQHIHCCFCRGGVWDGVKDMLGLGARNEYAGGTRYTG